MTLTFGSLFAGIGGFDLGFERAGMTCKWQVEKNDFCQKVLTKHWPNVPKHGDIKDVGQHNLTAVDVICGGFPCQPHSLAGQRKASDDERDLWGEMFRIIGEIKPQWVVAENVPGLLSSENGRYFGRVLRDLAGLGYDAEWFCISASAFGAPHRRKRIFIVANSHGYRIQRSLEKPLCGQQKVQGFEDVRSVADLRRGPGIHHPALCRNIYGFPNGVDRVRSVGNAVVPQVAEFIAQCLQEATA